MSLCFCNSKSKDETSSTHKNWLCAARFTFINLMFKFFNCHRHYIIKCYLLCLPVFNQEIVNYRGKEAFAKELKQAKLLRGLT